MKKKPTKTKYCRYFSACERPENCFEGEYCPVYDLTDEFVVVKTEFVEPQPFEKIMDEIWDGT